MVLRGTKKMKPSGSPFGMEKPSAPKSNVTIGCSLKPSSGNFCCSVVALINFCAFTVTLTVAFGSSGSDFFPSWFST